jgi:hypothetical protein
LSILCHIYIFFFWSFFNVFKVVKFRALVITYYYIQKKIRPSFDSKWRQNSFTVYSGSLWYGIHETVSTTHTCTCTCIQILFYDWLIYAIYGKLLVYQRVYAFLSHDTSINNHNTMKLDLVQLRHCKVTTSLVL